MRGRKGSDGSLSPNFSRDELIARPKTVEASESVVGKIQNIVVWFAQLN